MVKLGFPGFTGPTGQTVGGLQAEACGSECSDLSLWAVHLDDPMGSESPLRAVQNDVSPFYIAGLHRLYGGYLPLR